MSSSSSSVASAATANDVIIYMNKMVDDKFDTIRMKVVQSADGLNYTIQVNVQIGKEKTQVTIPFKYLSKYLSSSFTMMTNEATPYIGVQFLIPGFSYGLFQTKKLSEPELATALKDAIEMSLESFRV